MTNHCNAQLSHDCQYLTTGSNHSAQLNKLTSAVWDYCLGKSSFMSFTANIGCFKPRHEMFKHIWTCDSWSD